MVYFWEWLKGPRKWLNRAMIVFLGLMVGAVLVVLASMIVARTWPDKRSLVYLLPKVLIVIVAIVQNRSDLLVGGLVGENLSQLLFVIALVALTGGRLAIVGEFSWWEMAATLVVTSAPVILLLDGGLSRLDGVILLIVALIYSRISELSRRRNKPMTKPSRYAGWIIAAGLLGLLVGADLLTLSLSGLAQALVLPVELVGLLILALVLSASEASAGRRFGLSLAGLMGGLVTNSCLLIGLVTFIRPVIIHGESYFALANVFFGLMFGMFWLLVKTKKKISRGEGLILVGIYLMFVGLGLLVV